jgi:hypothetical protein
LFSRSPNENSADYTENYVINSPSEAKSTAGTTAAIVIVVLLLVVGASTGAYFVVDADRYVAFISLKNLIARIESSCEEGG